MYFDEEILTVVRSNLALTNGGPKIDPSLTAGIFEPFFMTKDVGQATGIGLSIARKIMECHGGGLRLDLLETNTTFVMNLPEKTKAPL